MPVICIGNLVAGGSGKTPVARAVLQLVKNNILAQNPCFLTRGYGHKAKGYFLVNRDAHTSHDVGDESLLLAKNAPVIIASHRFKGAQYAENNDFDLIIMDDGLQNPSLHKDVRFVVIDGVTGFGNKQCLPAGPLRTPIKNGLQNAEAFIILGQDQHQIQDILPKDKPVFHGEIVVAKSWIADQNASYVAFCGLAHPDKFKKTLTEAGLHIVSWHPYADHYPYTAQDLKFLSDQAYKQHARLITTEKDVMRIPAEFTHTHPFDILPIDIQWEDE